MMNLEDKLYTSTEVAQILGVSLRSLYRYIEDGKLDPEVRTATGRHRFTRQNILDFLYPSKDTQPEKKPEPAPVEKPAEKKDKAIVEEAEQKPEVKAEPVEQEEPVDWLSKFREAATKFKSEQAQVQVEEVDTGDNIYTSEPINAKPKFVYFRSLVGGLKDIAQNIDKSSRRSFIDYAFTLNAGMSLHRPIKPFSILHAYVDDSNLDFFERVLNLIPSDEKNAQLCLIPTKDRSIFDSKHEMHGLFVVSDDQLKKDLLMSGEAELAAELN